MAAVAALTAACTSDSEPGPSPGTSATGSAAAQVAACLQDKGWDVSVHPDNSYSVGGIPSDQAAQYEADQEECSQPLDDPPPPMTEQQAEQYFDDLREVADCIREQGYPVGEPPSRGAAIEALMQSVIDLDGWPYDDALRSMDSNEHDALYAACPQPQRPS